MTARDIVATEMIHYVEVEAHINILCFVTNGRPRPWMMINMHLKRRAHSLALQIHIPAVAGRTPIKKTYPFTVTVNHCNITRQTDGPTDAFSTTLMPSTFSASLDDSSSLTCQHVGGAASSACHMRYPTFLDAD